MKTFTVEPFQPHPWLRHAHLQTVVTNFVAQSYHKRPIPYMRIRLNTPDGDFIDVDEVYNGELPPNAPLVLLLHGLEGSARSGYATITYTLMQAQGYRCVGMNYRSCSGDLNRTAKLYHLGATEDVALVLDWLMQRYPNAPKLLLGFSMGANLVLKYLGECGTAAPIAAAAAVSPPFHLAGQHHTINAAGGFTTIYRRRFLGRLKDKVRRKAHLIHAAGGDVYRALHAQTLEEFDNAIIAPLHGFADATDYYTQAACAPFLPHITVPTLIIRALDDPFFCPDIPTSEFAANPALYPFMLTQGGHVGFLEGTPRQPRFWAHQQAARFFQTMLT
jgi:hypothetical protein